MTPQNFFLNIHPENGNSALREEIRRTSFSLGKPRAI